MTATAASLKLAVAVVEWLQNTIWFWGLSAQAVLTAGMVWRGTRAYYPTFFAYIAYQTAKSFVLVGLKVADPWLYFWGYWVGEFFSLILALAVLQELFESMIRHEDRARRLGTILFWIVACAALGIVASTMQIGAGSRESRLMTGVLTAEQALRIVQSGVLLFLFAFSGLSKVPWLPAARGIALGMGLFIAAELVIVTARQIYGPDFRTAFYFLKPLAYAVAMVVWIRALVYLRVPAKDTAPVPSKLGGVNADLAEMLR